MMSIYLQKHSPKILPVRSTQNLLKLNRVLKRKKLNFDSKNSKDCNILFTLTELVDSNNKSHNTDVGPDEMHKEF